MTWQDFMKNVKVGDTVQNKFVGTCEVEKIEFAESGSKVFAWMEVSYEAIHQASGEVRRFLRTDPIGLDDDGTPFFWK